MVNPLGLELKSVVNCCVGAENFTQSSLRAASALTIEPFLQPWLFLFCLAVLVSMVGSLSVLSLCQKTHVVPVWGKMSLPTFFQMMTHRWLLFPWQLLCIL